MDDAARLHALEVLVDVLITSLRAEERRRVARDFAQRAEIAKSAMLQSPMQEPLRQSVEAHLDRLSARLNEIAVQR